MALEVINAFENVQNTKNINDSGIIKSLKSLKSAWSEGIFTVPWTESRESHNDLMNYSKHGWKLEINFSAASVLITLSQWRWEISLNFSCPLMWTRGNEMKSKITKFIHPRIPRRRNFHSVIRWKQIVWWFLQKIKQFSLLYECTKKKTVDISRGSLSLWVEESSPLFKEW